MLPGSGERAQQFQTHSGRVFIPVLRTAPIDPPVVFSTLGSVVWRRLGVEGALGT